MYQELCIDQVWLQNIRVIYTILKGCVKLFLKKRKRKEKKKKDALNQDSYCFSWFYPKKKKKLLLSRGLLGLLDLLYSSSYLQTLIDSWESKLSLKTRSWKWDSRCNIKLSTIWSTSYWNLFFSKNWVRETS